MGMLCASYIKPSILFAPKYTFISLILLIAKGVKENTFWNNDVYNYRSGIYMNKTVDNSKGDKNIRIL